MYNHVNLTLHYRAESFHSYKIPTWPVQPPSYTQSLDNQFLIFIFKLKILSVCVYVQYDNSIGICNTEYQIGVISIIYQIYFISMCWETTGYPNFEIYHKPSYLCYLTSEVIFI